jgi:hypothetical protein
MTFLRAVSTPAGQAAKKKNIHVNQRLAAFAGALAWTWTKAAR